MEEVIMEAEVDMVEEAKDGKNMTNCLDCVRISVN